MHKALAAAGCASEAEFRQLPKEEQKAFLAHASGSERAKGSAPAGLQMLDPATVRRSPFNRSYFDKDEMAKLVASVKDKGVTQPGMVRPVRPPDGAVCWEIIAGERRWTAATQAKVLFPAIIHEATDTEALELQASAGCCPRARPDCSPRSRIRRRRSNWRRRSRIRKQGAPRLA